MKKGLTGRGGHPWSHIHDIYMETNGIEKFLETMESTDAGATAGEKAADNSWKDVVAETKKLTRLVQGGRYVTKAQMLEVEQETHGPSGFFRR